MRVANAKEEGPAPTGKTKREDFKRFVEHF